MDEPKYYDWTLERGLDDADGASFESWLSGSEARFATHPDGFRVFLPPEALDASDEYKDADPYSVNRNTESAFQRRRFQQTVDLVAAAVADLDRPRILDIGCGEGHLTGVLAGENPNAEISALDYSISAVARANAAFPSVDFAVSDAYEAPFAPEYFDVVVCNNLWEHVPDPMRLLAAMRRVLRKDGHLVLSTPSRYRLGNLLRILRGRPIGLMSELHVTEYSVGQVKEQLRFGEFEVVTAGADPLPNPEGTLAQRWIRPTLIRALSAATRAVGSHHSWEGTVMFLARKR